MKLKFKLFWEIFSLNIHQIIATIKRNHLKESSHEMNWGMKGKGQ